MLPDPSGDSCTFLSWFLPTEELTRAVVAELKEQGILAGNFYWYENNWHYIRKWDHLRQAATLITSTSQQRRPCRTFAGLFPRQRRHHESLCIHRDRAVMDGGTDKGKRRENRSGGKKGAGAVAGGERSWQGYPDGALRTISLRGD